MSLFYSTAFLAYHSQQYSRYSSVRSLNTELFTLPCQRITVFRENGENGENRNEVFSPAGFQFYQQLERTGEPRRPGPPDPRTSLPETNERPGEAEQTQRGQCYLPPSCPSPPSHHGPLGPGQERTSGSPEVWCGEPMLC